MSGLSPAGPELRQGSTVRVRGHPGVEVSAPLSVTELGFSLHARTTAGADDARARQQLVKYVLRPPLAQERLTLLPNELVSIALKRPFKDGTVAIDLDPLSLLVRLASAVPPPRTHQVKYFGVLGAAAKLRARVVPPPPEPKPDARAASAGHGHAQSADRPATHRSRYRSWSELLKRTFESDVEKCEKCGNRMQLKALVTRPISSSAGSKGSASRPTRLRCRPPVTRPSSGSQCSGEGSASSTGSPKCSTPSPIGAASGAWVCPPAAWRAGTRCRPSTSSLRNSPSLQQATRQYRSMSLSHRAFPPRQQTRCLRFPRSPACFNYAHCSSCKRVKSFRVWSRAARQYPTLAPSSSVHLVDFQIGIFGGGLAAQDEKKLNEAAFPIYEAGRLWLKERNVTAPFRKIVVMICNRSTEAQYHGHTGVALNICQVHEAEDVASLLKALPGEREYVRVAAQALEHVKERTGWENPEFRALLESVSGSDPPCAHRFAKLQKQHRRTGVVCDVWFTARYRRSAVSVKFKHEGKELGSAVLIEKPRPLFLEDELPMKTTKIEDEQFVILDKSKQRLAVVSVPPPPP